MSEHSAEFDAHPGTVVRYRPDPSRHDPRWCREGMAIADARGFLFDTYWASGGDSHRLLPIERDTIEVLFYLSDYDELDRYSNVSKGVWATYAPDDRRLVTSQHGLIRRWFVRKGARPDLGTQIANAEEKVRDCEEAVRAAQRHLDRVRQDLDAIRTSVIPPAQTQASS